MVDTEIYMDRYLPCKFLNVINDTMQSGKLLGSEKLQRKFVQGLKKKFS